MNMMNTMKPKVATVITLEETMVETMEIAVVPMVAMTEMMEMVVVWR
jgi:hypothetical protein